MQVHLTTLGCRLNEAELENWAAGFMSKGHAITQKAEQADVVVINTSEIIPQQSLSSVAATVA